MRSRSRWRSSDAGWCRSRSGSRCIYEYSCVEGDRRDLVAATHLSDAELWWRLADANGVIDPETLTRPVGTVVRITTQENVTGGTGG